MLRSYQDGHRLMAVCTHVDYYSATPLGNQPVRTLTQYPTQSYYPDTDLTSPCPILLVLNARLGSKEYDIKKGG